MTARDRRALVWGGAAILGAIVALRVAPWAVHSVRELHSSVAERRELVERARAVLDGRQAVQDSLGRTLSAIVALAPKLVDGRSGAEAQAALTSLLSLAAGRQALKVVRLDGLSDSAAGVFNRVGVHAELEGDVAGVARLLRGVETGSPVLSVTSLRLAPADPATGPTTPERLRVEVTVAGYYLPRGAR